MGIFDFIKKKKQETISPQKILQRLVEYMPDEYAQQKQFLNCREYLEYNEFGLALDSLIELTSETDHYFSEEFWQELKKAAKEMDMKSAVDYSNEQLKRNATDLDSITPFGWSTLKVDNTHYQSFISSKLKNEWAEERREKDKIQRILTKNGIHHKPHGRSGYIYYVKDGKLAEVEYELGMEGLILWFDSVNEWVLPEHRSFDDREKEELKNAIIEWSTRTKNAIEFD